MNTTTQRGGKRENSGRKSVHGGKSVAIRVNADLLPFIEQLKAGNFESVQNQNSAESSELSAKIDELKALNLRFISERDCEHQKALALQTQIESLKRDANTLREEINRLKQTEHNCQAIKSNGERYT